MYRLNPSCASDPSRRDLPEDRPREKLVRRSLEYLSEEELLMLVLGKGSGTVSVEQLAAALNPLIFLPNGRAAIPSLEDCLKVKGLGAAKASAVIAGLELGRRAQSFRGRPIHTPEDALSHLSWMRDCKREHFHALYLDTRRRLLASETVSVGTLEASLVHPREVFVPAVRLSASAILVAHNHPSGDPEPSAEDLALTRRLDKAANLLGIRMLDHLIVAGTDWISLRQRQCDGESGIELFAA